MFVNQKSVALSSTSSRVRPVGSPSKARLMSCKLGWSWSSIVSGNPEWLREGKIVNMVQFSTAKHADLPNVHTEATMLGAAEKVVELARS